LEGAWGGSLFLAPGRRRLLLSSSRRFFRVSARARRGRRSTTDPGGPRSYGESPRRRRGSFAQAPRAGFMRVEILHRTGAESARRSNLEGGPKGGGYGEFGRRLSVFFSTIAMWITANTFATSPRSSSKPSTLLSIKTERERKLPCARDELLELDLFSARSQITPS